MYRYSYMDSCFYSQIQKNMDTSNTFFNQNIWTNQNPSVFQYKIYIFFAAHIYSVEWQETEIVSCAAQDI